MTTQRKTGFKETNKGQHDSGVGKDTGTRGGGWVPLWPTAPEGLTHSFCSTQALPLESSNTASTTRLCGAPSRPHGPVITARPFSAGVRVDSTRAEGCHRAQSHNIPHSILTHKTPVPP